MSVGVPPASAGTLPAAGVPPVPSPSFRGRLRSRGRRMAGRVLVALVVLCCAGTAMAEVAGPAMASLGPLGNAFEIASNLRLQYLVFLAGAAAVLLALGSRRLAALAGLAALLNLIRVVPLALDEQPGAPGSAVNRTYRVLFTNVWYENENHDGLIRLVRLKDPDVILLAEVTPAWVAALSELRNEYPYGEAFPRLDSGGVAILSRIPLESVQRLPFGAWKRPVIVAEARLDAGSVTLISVHPYSSRGPQRARIRERQLLGVAGYAASRPGPVLVAGDLNVTPWSPVFRAVLQRSGLRNGRLGYGALPTWPAYIPLLGVPVDHALVSPSIALHELAVGPYMGSDHLPLTVDFALAGTTDGDRSVARLR